MHFCVLLSVRSQRLEEALFLHDNEFQEWWRENVDNVAKPRGYFRDYWKQLLLIAAAAFVALQMYVHLIILEKNPQLKKVYLHEKRMQKHDREDIWKTILAERQLQRIKEQRQKQQQ